jgi:hypothetical protein
MRVKRRGNYGARSGSPGWGLSSAQAEQPQRGSGRHNRHIRRLPRLRSGALPFKIPMRFYWAPSF